MQSKTVGADLDSEHETTLFHKEVRCLSKRNMFKRLYELREEVSVFLIEKGMTDLLKQFCNPKFEIRLAYLVDIFVHLNKLNLQLQGSGNTKLEGSANIFVFEDKLRAFICKLELWVGKIETTNYLAFPTLKTFSDDKNYSQIRAEIQHLHELKKELTRYFPECNDIEAEAVRKTIRNPFSVNVEELPDEIQEEVIELQNDSNCKDTFESGINLQNFWCQKAISYNNALRHFVMFSTTYLCGEGFYNLLLIKNK
jgi:hypothetical protein